MNNVQSFTFFNGYFEAIKDLNEKDKKDVLLAITEYVFEEKEPDYKGIKKSLWALIKPTLDKSIIRSKVKQNKIKTKSNQNQNENKTKTNQNQNEIKSEQCPLLEKEKEKEIEEEEINKEEVDKIVKCFSENIGTLNPASAELLFSYKNDFSEEMIIEAIKIAGQRSAHNVKYVCSILNDWKRKNLKVPKDIKQKKEFEKEVTGLDDLYEN